jgi:pimeloyl-ACP methyl ester carboxylesterase
MHGTLSKAKQSGGLTMKSMRRCTTLFAAILGALMLTAVESRGVADKCLAGASAAADATDLVAARTAVETFCDCAAFGGTAPDRTHGKFVQCVAGVINAKAKARKLRTQCKVVAHEIYSNSTCGYTTTPKNGDKVPCVKKVVATGKVTCAIKAQLTCTSSKTGTYTQVPCPQSFFCLDAADSSGNLQIDPADSGACTVVPGPILGATTDIPSGAQPPNTPGSPAVSMPANLQTQFGKKPFSLNQARYTRWRFSRLRTTPEAILVLIPGFEGGAGGFKILAENLLQRMQNDYGRVIEVWGYDRRTNQLEDTTGLDIAEIYDDPQIGLDWLFGSELGLTLSPALKPTPKRRAVFYNPQEDVPFLANWTNLVFSRDIDAVVDAARARASKHNVFLGGHSAGTWFTARYAATDFDLTGAGPAKPGYAKLRGLVLLDGGGGSTGGAPLTDDTLDRIVAKFDGGLYAAVRDNAPRCVDGSPCTSDSNCAGKTPPKCVQPTTAYAQFMGLLSPRLLAAAEPGAIQGLSDPDGGQIIFQVDQLGIPGNNAVNIVPDLGALKLLPPGTVEGAIGNFVDDDGLLASFAFFVAMSVGAPGPVVGGLTTWTDITEDAFAPCFTPGCPTPYNGAPPTTIPASGVAWGQEKEVTRFDRLMTTFFTGGTNFTDWYYPNAGPSTTSVSGKCSSLAGNCVAGNVGAACVGTSQALADAQCNQAIDLDSTALSVGRGRRDIENLTQAANINIPVIAFGASNGLTPVPGNYIPFASSIGLCTAPSCDTTSPRVVNAALPNPAFPTFGDINGGFETHISEGFAHVDVLTAEDNASNNVVAPLAAFLERNVVP